MSDTEDDKKVCGCGRPTRYHSIDGKDSCNKYLRCPSYDELMKENRDLKKFKETLIEIRDVNAMDYEYRKWAKNVLEE